MVSQTRIKECLLTSFSIYVMYVVISGGLHCHGVASVASDLAVTFVT